MKPMARTQKASFVILLTTALALCFRLLSTSKGNWLAARFLVLGAAAFVVMALLARGRKIPLDYRVGAGFAAWFVLSRALLGDAPSHWWTTLCLLMLAYLLAFPYAFATDGAARRNGLIAVALAFFAAQFVFALLGLLSVVTGTLIEFSLEEAYFGVIYEYGETRLWLTRHPNISAEYLFVALLAGLWLMFTLKRRWMVLPWLFASACIYACIALCGSRTVMAQTALAAGAAAFAGALHAPVRQGWLRWAAACAAGAAAAWVAFAGFDLALHACNLFITWLPTALAETTELVQAVPERVGGNLLTLNSRTEIWAGVLRMLWENPRVLLLGMPEGELSGMLQQYTFSITAHAHNSYLQTAMLTGLPGVLMALYFAVRAVWVSFRLMFCRPRAAFADRLVAVSLLTMLVSTLLECYLFTHFEILFGFLFFLLLGYALETERKLNA